MKVTCTNVRIDTSARYFHGPGVSCDRYHVHFEGVGGVNSIDKFDMSVDVPANGAFGSSNPCPYSTGQVYNVEVTPDA
jgi:hypothetical protein